MYVKFISNEFLRFLYNFFIQMPLEIYWRFLTAYIPSGATWINYTSVPDSVLQEQWTLAQQGLATAPFPQNDAGSDMHAPIPEALAVQPKHVTVISVPDITPGAIVTPDMNEEACHSFACCWKKPRVYAAQSKIPVTLAYEMQNIILSELGYDVSNR
jgi:hypothetical protein